MTNRADYVKSAVLGCAMMAVVVFGLKTAKAMTLPSDVRQPEDIDKVISQVANEERLPELVSKWRTEYEKTGSPLYAVAFAKAVDVESRLAANHLSVPASSEDSQLVYSILQRACEQEKTRVYPVVAMYYWISRNPDLTLGFDRSIPSRIIPCITRDSSGKVVASGYADVHDKPHPRLKSALDLLNREMLRRQSSDPEVLYIQALRESNPHRRVEYLLAASSRGGDRRFRAYLWMSLANAWRDLGERGEERRMRAELRGYLAAQGNTVMVRYLKASHPEIMASD